VLDELLQVLVKAQEDATKAVDVARAKERNFQNAAGIVMKCDGKGKPAAKKKRVQTAGATTARVDTEDAMMADLDGKESEAQSTEAVAEPIPAADIDDVMEADVSLKQAQSTEAVAEPIPAEDIDDVTEADVSLKQAQSTAAKRKEENNNDGSEPKKVTLSLLYNNS